MRCAYHLIFSFLLLDSWSAQGTKHWPGEYGVLKASVARNLVDWPEERDLSASSAMSLQGQTNQVVGLSLTDAL